MQIKNEIEGWLIIDKPLNMGSTQVVSRLKHLLHPTKIGHAGTLDPLATGVLPIAFGKATKTIPYVMEGKKEYLFDVTFGTQTDTDDLAGKVIQSSDVIPSKEQIEQILPEFTGSIWQRPPAYCALKIAGKRAYDLARNGQNPELKERQIQIDACQLQAFQGNTASFYVKCSKGTYVRSLGRDIALKLGTVGHISKLRRISCLPFSLKDTFLLENLEKMEYNQILSRLTALSTALSDISVLAVDADQARALCQGKSLPAMGDYPDLVRAVFNDKTIALLERKEGVWHPFRVLVNTLE